MRYLPTKERCCCWWWRSSSSHLFPHFHSEGKCWMFYFAFPTASGRPRQTRTTFRWLWFVLYVGGWNFYNYLVEESMQISWEPEGKKIFMLLCSLPTWTIFFVFILFRNFNQLNCLESFVYRLCFNNCLIYAIYFVFFSPSSPGCICPAFSLYSCCMRQGRHYKAANWGPLQIRTLNATSANCTLLSCPVHWQDVQYK